MTTFKLKSLAAPKSVSGSTLTTPTMEYSDYIKLVGYLSANCTDKEYHKAMIKLDKFKIIVED